MYITISLIALIFIFFLFSYNSLISRKNMVKNSFAAIDVQLKKRYDLIPNLVATVKQYMEYEKNLLNELTELRAKAISNDISDNEKINLDNQISKSMRSIFAVAENYPDLKASQNMELLQRSLNEVEEQLAAARRSYNAAVTSFNNAIEMFPSNIVAAMMNYKTRTLFETPTAQKENVNINNLFNVK